MSSIEHIRGCVSHDVELVNNLILSSIPNDVDLIEALSHHIVDSGGKRLRPLMLLLTSRACGYEGLAHIKLAVVVEFFHTATLLHDDVVDESSLRRGRETANSIWGSKASVLVGDYLFTQSIKYLVEVGRLDILNLMAGSAHDITRGEVVQMQYRQNITLSEQNYFEIIKAKTALLFATSTAIGAQIADQPESIINALYEYGLHIGYAFQLVDDALDYISTKETLGKNIGDDLADGKMTLPLIHALLNANPEEQVIIKTAISNLDRTALPQILDIIEKTGAINYTYQKAEESVKYAKKQLESLPESIYKKALLALADYSLSRRY